MNVEIFQNTSFTAVIQYINRTRRYKQHTKRSSYFLGMHKSYTQLKVALKKVTISRFFLLWPM